MKTSKKNKVDKTGHPADHENTVTRKAEENPATQNNSDLNETNKAYAKTGTPGKDDNASENQDGEKYENWGSEFGTDPLSIEKASKLNDENENVTQRSKDKNKNPKDR